MRSGAAAALIFGTAILQLFSLSALEAQAVEGRLLDMEAGTPILLGRMTLLDVEGHPLTVTTTGTDGHFLLVAPGPGQYWIQIESSFHRGFTDGPVSLTGADTVSLTFELLPLPVELDELTVEGESRSPRLALEGVYDRREAGIGAHFDEERIRARTGGRVSQLIALLPMVELLPDTTFNRNLSRVVFRRGQFERLIRPEPPLCFPQVFLNGAVFSPGGSSPAELDVFSLADVEAIEVYDSPTEVPNRFRGQNAHCGTIVLWTR